MHKWIRGTKSSIHNSVCSERSFLSLVHSEAKRAERSGHLCRILLVYRANPQGLFMPLGAELGDKTISLLSHSCRDTDSVGWYRQGHIVGVLLTTLQPYSVVDGCKTLQARLTDRLCAGLALREAHSLQMYVLEPDKITTFNASNHSLAPPA